MLLVEDSLADAELARVAIGRASLDVEVGHANTGDEARLLLDEVLARGAGPRAMLILLDLNLPGTDSLALLEEWKSSPRTRVLPVVAFSGTSDPSLAHRVLDLHANAFVPKTGEVEQFMERVRCVTEAFLLYACMPLARH